MTSEDITAAALASAASALEQDAFSWIRERSLTERAYFLGLYNGLCAVAPTPQLEGILRRAVLGTAFARPADDPFLSSVLGTTLKQLEVSLTGNAADHTASIDRDLASLRVQLQEADTTRENAARRARELLSSLAEAIDARPATADDLSARDRVAELCARLERTLRLFELPQRSE